MLINELEKNIFVESDVVEFKRFLKEGINEKGKENYEFNWLKEIAAFANTKGGVIYIGVDDKTHEIIPFNHEIFDKLVLMIHRNIKEHLEPLVKYMISELPLKEESSVKFILKLEIFESKLKPVILKFHNAGFIYVRHYGETSIASSEEIRDLVLNSENISYDEEIIDEDFNEKDFTKLFNYYKKVNNKKLTLKELISINFITINKKLTKGAELFKDDISINKTLVECVQFKGINKGDDTFYATKTIKSNLLDEYFQIKDFILSRSANGFIKKNDGSREELISFPLKALDEGIINALVHRNYFINGSQIEINLFKDRLEIISPGSLLNSPFLNREKNLSSIPPLRRNEIISNVFTMLKLMEKRGSGFDKIVEEYSHYDKKYAPFASSSSSYFSLTLPDLSFKEGLIDEYSSETPDIYINENRKNKYDLKILSFCFNKAKSVKEIASFLNIKPSSYFRKKIIEPLIKDDYLIKQNISKKESLYYSNKEKVFLE